MSPLTSSLTNTPPRLKVINFWGGPGIGKSSMAAQIFAKMKADDLRVEYVPEYAKDITYDGDVRRINNQLLILGRQFDRLDRLDGQVDYVVNDSPLPLGLVYLNPRWRTEAFVTVTRDTFNLFDNTDILLRRVKPYQHYGRRQTEEEARTLDAKIVKVFYEFVPEDRRWYADGDPKAADAIYRRIKNQVVV